MAKYGIILTWVTIIVCVFTTTAMAQQLGEPFDLELGQEVTVQNTGLMITFKSVDEDSRCPEGAQCKWAGNAKVTLQISQTSFSLNTFYGYPNQAAYSDYIVRLVALRPYPKPIERIKPEEDMRTVATLLVTKATNRRSP